MLTDRDIVVKCIAEGGDAASATAGQFGQGKVVAIGADDEVEEALRTMSEHQVRRLPVIDGDELVGMLAQADIARHLDESRTGEVVQHISSDGSTATDSAAEQEPPDSNISGGRFGGKES
jgi:predicted transcriptional regulator